MTEATPRFVNDLRDELVAAAQRKIESRRRRQRRALHGLAAIASLIILTSVLRFTEKPANAGVLDITKANGVITVNLKTERANTHQITDELNRYGVDAKVLEVPVSDSGIGKFVALSHDSSSTNSNGSSSTYFQQFTLPDQKQQKVDLWFGRKANGNEEYAKTINAFDPGEILHCSGTLGRTVQEALPKLKSRHLVVTWQQVSGELISKIDSGQYSSYLVTAAATERPNTVRVLVSAEAAPLFGSTTDCA